MYNIKDSELESFKLLTSAPRSDKHRNTDKHTNKRTEKVMFRGRFASKNWERKSFIERPTWGWKSSALRSSWQGWPWQLWPSLHFRPDCFAAAWSALNPCSWCARSCLRCSASGSPWSLKMSARIGAWKRNFPPHYEIMTDWPTKGRTWCFMKLHFY